MVTHLISTCIFSAIATSYILLLTMQSNPFTERGMVRDSRFIFEIFCWVFIALKLVDINSMLTFHLSSIPKGEVELSFYILAVCNFVALAVTIPLLLQKFKDKLKGVRLVMVMQVLLLLELFIVGSYSL